MSHHLAALSPLDFENLCADILGADLSVRFELFAQGPDGGIDFRYQSADTQIIGQAKHYAQWRELKRAVAQERGKLEKLSPQRYVLFTSCALTPGNKDELLTLLRPYCQSTADIWGRDDVDAGLSRHPQVLRRHVKLWLQDEAQLHAVIHAGLLQLSAARQADLQQDMMYFVAHPMIEGLCQRLKTQNILLISGDAGVGKTTACAYLALQLAAADGYEFHFLHGASSISNAWELLRTDSKQCLVLDDFLGAAFLDPLDVVGIEQELVALLNKAARSGGQLKLILATRDYVLNQAAERLPKLEAWLRLEKPGASAAIEYRKISICDKADMLYNLIFFSNLPPMRREVLIKNKVYEKLVEHPHFNPRLLKNIFNDPGAIDVPDISAWLLGQLDNPAGYWEKTFLRLSKEAQCLLYALAFSSAPIAEIDLTQGFGILYKNMHGCLPQADSLQAAVAELEPNLLVSFAVPGCVWLRFANPGVADMVYQLMAKHPGLTDALLSSIRFYEQGQQLYRLSQKQDATLALTTAQIPVLLETMERHVGVGLRQLHEAYPGKSFITVSGEAPHLADFWHVFDMSRGSLAVAIAQKLTDSLTRRARQADWGLWCAQQSYGPLTDMAFVLLEGEALRQVVEAMIEQMANSQDALYMAQLHERGDIAPFLDDALRNSLLDKIVAVCEAEVNRADDDDHLAAVLEDIEEIREIVPVDMDDVRYRAWEKMEDAYAPGDDGAYDPAMMASFRKRSEEYQAAWAYVGALLSQP